MRPNPTTPPTTPPAIAPVFVPPPPPPPPDPDGVELAGPVDVAVTVTTAPPVVVVVVVNVLVEALLDVVEEMICELSGVSPTFSAAVTLKKSLNWLGGMYAHFGMSVPLGIVSGKTPCWEVISAGQ